MAINPNTQYPGQVEAPDANYPLGGAKNETVVDALDGTPFEKAMLNDIFGFQQALLSQAGITASGNSETALVSQYLAAMYQFMAEAKNFAINGTGVIQQRGDYTLVKDVYDFGPDRFAGMATGTAVSAGTLTQIEAANIGVTGFAHKFDQVTITGAGIIYHRTRLESKDAKNFKNQKAALSCKVYHDVGSAIDYTLFVRKANAEDDFSAVTVISNDGGTSVDSATATELKFEDITMGDCSNGIEIELKIECGAITLKDFEQTEYQLKVGEAATPFKPESTDSVMAQCQRYYEKSYDLDVDPGTAAVDNGEVREDDTRNNAGFLPGVRFAVAKRTTPTVIIYSPDTGTVGKVANSADKDGVALDIGENGVVRVSIAGGSAGANARYHWAARAEL